MGLVHDTRRTVTKEMSPQHLPVNVLSTPYLVAFVEECCTLASDPYMDEGEATVGTHVCISHDARWLKRGRTSLSDVAWLPSTNAD